MTAQRVALIRQKLEAAFAPTELSVQDDGHKHIGHAGAKTGLGHFNVSLRSSEFTGHSMLERHRMVYASLGDLMQTDIHALSIRALTPDE